MFVCVCMCMWLHESWREKSLQPRKHLKVLFCIDLHINSCVPIHMHTRTHTHTHTHTYTYTCTQVHIRIHTHTYTHTDTHTHMMYTGKFNTCICVCVCWWVCECMCGSRCMHVCAILHGSTMEWLYSFSESDNTAIVINEQLLFFAAACKTLFMSYIWISHVTDMAQL